MKTPGLALAFFFVLQRRTTAADPGRFFVDNRTTVPADNREPAPDLATWPVWYC